MTTQKPIPAGENPLADLSEFVVYETSYDYTYTDWITGMKRTMKFAVPQRKKLP